MTFKNAIPGLPLVISRPAIGSKIEIDNDSASVYMAKGLRRQDRVSGVRCQVQRSEVQRGKAKGNSFIS